MTLNSIITLSKLKRRLLKHIWLARAGLILAVAAGVVAFAFACLMIFRLSGADRYAKLAKSFIFPATSGVRIIDGRINILVMGKGGAGHDAPDLTDTLVFVSIDTNQKKITSISIPRDIWIAEMRAKINSAYYYGNKMAPGGGLVLAKSTVEEVIGQPVPYAVVVDFTAFKDVVDTLGGVTINVDRSFTDYLYPIAGKENDTCGGDPLFGCRYETVTFNAGVQTMNGETALKFVRSRHAVGDEGTDLARDARQQKVIEAIKEKLMNPKTYLNLKVVSGLIKVVNNYVETDIAPNTAAAIARYGFASRKNVNSSVISTDLLLAPPTNQYLYDNQFVFIPIGGNWNKIHEWVSGKLIN